MRKHTSLCLCILLALPFLLPTHVLGQSLETYCGACRDVRAHPMDFGNHAFNVVFAQAESDAGTLLNATVMVSNPLGQRVPVYLSRVMEETGLSLGISPFFYYQVPFPSPFVQIAVQKGAVASTDSAMATSTSASRSHGQSCSCDGPAPTCVPPVPADATICVESRHRSSVAWSIGSRSDSRASVFTATRNASSPL